MVPLPIFPEMLLKTVSFAGPSTGIKMRGLSQWQVKSG
jgi:hypothetical protein